MAGRVAGRWPADSACHWKGIPFAIARRTDLRLARRPLPAGRRHSRSPALLAGTARRPRPPTPLLRQRASSQAAAQPSSAADSAPSAPQMV